MSVAYLKSFSIVAHCILFLCHAYNSWISSTVLQSSIHTCKYRMSLTVRKLFMNITFTLRVHSFVLYHTIIKWLPNLCMHCRYYKFIPDKVITRYKDIYLLGEYIFSSLISLWNSTSICDFFSFWEIYFLIVQLKLCRAFL